MTSEGDRAYTVTRLLPCLSGRSAMHNGKTFFFFFSLLFRAVSGLGARRSFTGLCASARPPVSGSGLRSIRGWRSTFRRIFPASHTHSKTPQLCSGTFQRPFSSRRDSKRQPPFMRHLQALRESLQPHDGGGERAEMIVLRSHEPLSPLTRLTVDLVIRWILSFSHIFVLCSRGRCLEFLQYTSVR